MSGNLCRCGCYVGIVEAIQQAAPQMREESPVQPFSYVRPRTVDDAVRAVASSGPDTKFLAGGTTLYDLMKLQVERPATVVDVTGLDELRQYTTGGARELVFGALVPMSRLAEDRRLLTRYPALADSAGTISRR